MIPDLMAGSLGDRLVGLVVGGTYEYAGFAVQALPSAHEGLDTDDRGRPLDLGYVVETEGIRGYHSGDSLVDDGLADALGTDPFGVLFPPINGRDPTRGVAGNISAVESVTLAFAIRPRFLVPRHDAMFTFNTVPIQVFEGEARRLPEGVTPRVLRCGERREVKR